MNKHYKVKLLNRNPMFKKINKKSKVSLYVSPQLFKIYQIAHRDN